MNGTVDLPVCIYVLGTTRVTIAGAPLELRSIRQRQLLAALVLARGAEMDGDRLVEAVWRDELPDHPRSALLNQISRLRSTLGPAAEVIKTGPGGYRLDVERAEIDVRRFEALLSEARAEPDAARRAQRLRTALELWAGEPYADLDMDDARPEVSRLTEWRLAAEEDALVALAESGDAQTVIASLQSFCTAEPLRERPRLELAKLLAAHNRIPEALRALEDYRRAVAAELGISPSEAFNSVYGALLVDDGGVATMDRARHVPRVVTRVFGRQADVTAVLDRLTTTRLLALVGPGGVGKTTLALLVSVTAATRYEHGAGYVDLSAVRSDDDLAMAFARGLGIDIRDPASLVRRLVEAVGTRELLIVIDNAEQCVASVAALVSDLLTSTARVDVLVTSREPLNVSGERLWPVEPLPAEHEADAAVALFLDRASAHAPRWTPTAGDLSTVTEICHRLDGLPLALELAAGQLRYRSLEELRRELDHPFRSLDRPGEATRHSGLRAMLDASYELLTPLERAVFERVSIFSAGFSRASATRCCHDIALPVAVDAAVDTLIHKSLVRVAARPYGSRCSMLETVRGYGMMMLREPGRVDSARRSHAMAMVDLVEKADLDIAGTNEARWVAQLDDERGDITSAFRWLLDGDLGGALRVVRSVYFYAFVRGRDDLRGLAKTAVDALESARPANGALVTAAFGMAADHVLARGDVAGARALLERGFAAAPDVAGADRYCHGVAGDVALFGGDLVAARTHYRAAEQGFRAAGLAAMAAWLRAAAALPDIYGSDPAGGLADATLARAQADACGCPSAQAFTRYVVAEALAGDDAAAARSELEAAVRLASGVDATFVAGLAHISLATLAARSDDPAGALPHYGVLLDTWRRSGNWIQQWNTLRTLVVVLTDLGDHDSAARLLAGVEAHAQAPRWGDDDARLTAAENACRAGLGHQRHDEARAAGALASPVEVVDLAARAIAAAAIARA